MKKALVATCVVAMTAFSVTGATADPVATARASAYGIDVGGSLLDDLIEREPEVTSVFPPGSSVEEDVVTVDGGSLVLEGVGIVQAETRGESTIVPALRPDDDTGGGGGDLLGGLLEGGGGGDLLGGLLDGGGQGGEDEEILIPFVNARGFSSISITGVALEDEAGGEAGGGLLGDLLGDATGGGGALQTQQVGDITGGGAEQLLTEVVFDALLRLGVIESEAVAVCAQDTVFFDVASRIVDDQGSDIEVGDLLDDVVRGVIDALGGGTEEEALLGDLINIQDHEFGPTADGTGFFVNALHITVGGGGGTIQTQQVPTVPDTTVPTVPDTTVPDTGGGGLLGDLLGGGDGGVDGDEPLLDIILGHSEVSATSCAAPPATSLVPTGDAGPSLPRTGGLGVLPAVLGVGLLGGALTAGRYALRA
ncbi:MAG TPA: hypothetical protein VGR26_06190, partial [Acidimicrobiales bacterium]|nr:hypothetical protein [Acidimicrobiales bacterium]